MTKRKTTQQRKRTATAGRRARARSKVDDASLIADEPAEPSTALVKESEKTISPVELEPSALKEVTLPKSQRRQRMVLGLLLIAMLAFGARWGHDWLVRGQFVVSTDDAYVRSDLTIISPKVAGYAAAILVAENARVKADELLVEIEPGDYALAVDAANGKISTQNATVDRISQQIEAQKAAVKRSEAQRDAAQADLKKASSELERTRELVRRSVSSRKLLDTAVADHARALANLASAEASILASLANVDVLAAQREEARRVREEYQTALRKAERDLSYTKIRAPFDGVVGNLSVKQGQLLEAGTRLLALVPLDSVYVEANFKETQIEGLRVGQVVDISVDAYKTRPVQGKIESISPAAGQEFSLLPPQNATGNFTKIVQRVPVRISIPAEVAAKGHLRPGLSVVVSVDTHDPEKPRPTLLGVLGLERFSAFAKPTRQ